ncbi:hypothetical protein ASD35_25405 [Pelomonas sp. Root1444]|nr:hypothetical protein ASD35_25405 [Pelomonas sp. Root1444]
MRCEEPSQFPRPRHRAVYLGLPFNWSFEWHAVVWKVLARHAAKEPADAAGDWVLAQAAMHELGDAPLSQDDVVLRLQLVEDDLLGHQLDPQRHRELEDKVAVLVFFGD